MKNFDWSSFTKRVYIKVNIIEVYNAWTKSDKLEKWFLSKASFFLKENKRILKDTNIKDNNLYNWTWYAQNTSEKGKILKANGKDLIEFTFAGNCKVQVKLIQDGEFTLVELTQKEIPTDEPSKQNIRLGCAFGWSFYLLNLKSYLEGGIDLRNKNTSLKNLINN